MSDTKKIGILGGGQLAMMLTQAAFKLNIKNITVLDPTLDCPAAKVGAKQIVGSFKDEDKIFELASQVDVLTIDTENVNVEALCKVHDSKITKVIPHPSSLYTIQNKERQKQFLVNGWGRIYDVPWYMKYNGTIPPGLKSFFVKTKYGGYDGKGVWKMNSKEEVDDLLERSGMKNDDIFIEECIPYTKELSIITFKSDQDLKSDLDLKSDPESDSESDSEPINYPIVETIQEECICKSTICPVPLDEDVRDKINQIAKNIITIFGSSGLFAIELFLTEDNKIYVNEVSPRVHNSGHYTIEGTNCSQFEQLIRILVGLPTIKPELISRSTVKMTNILANGDETDCPNYLLKQFNNYHWYNKTPLLENKFKFKRKIGHVTQILSLEDTPYPLVYIVMGSSSDLPTVQPAIDLLNSFNIPYKVDIVSAHRSPDWMYKFGKNVESWCGEVVIAAAGGAAHLPGMLASLTTLPVIGVPVPSKYLGGKDSLLSIVEMPDGVPVATVGIGKAKNAAILALKILGAENEVKKIMKQNREKVEMQRDILVL